MHLLCFGGGKGSFCQAYVILSHALRNTLSSCEGVRLAAACQACFTFPQSPDKLG
jgi:hypothetical protein